MTHTITDPGDEVESIETKDCFCFVNRPLLRSEGLFVSLN